MRRKKRMTLCGDSTHCFVLGNWGKINGPMVTAKGKMKNSSAKRFWYNNL